MCFANFFRYISKPKAYNQVLLYKTCEKNIISFSLFLKLLFYLEKFPSKSPHEVMSLVALNIGIAYEGLQKQMESVLGDEERLLHELDGYLENIDKNSR